MSCMISGNSHCGLLNVNRRNPHQRIMERHKRVIPVRSLPHCLLELRIIITHRLVASKLHITICRIIVLEACKSIDSLGS